MRAGAHTLNVCLLLVGRIVAYSTNTEGWFLSETAGQSCDAVCNANFLTCDPGTMLDNNEAVNSAVGMNDVIGALDNTVCESLADIQVSVGADVPSHNGNGQCFHSSPTRTVDSIDCAATSLDSYRLCWCSPMGNALANTDELCQLGCRSWNEPCSGNIACLRQSTACSSSNQMLSCLQCCSIRTRNELSEDECKTRVDVGLRTGNSGCTGPKLGTNVYPYGRLCTSCDDFSKLPSCIKGCELGTPPSPPAAPPPPGVPPYPIDAAGSAGDDPLFMGSDGVSYEVRGTPGATFNLISAAPLSVNSRFLHVPERFRAADITDTVLGDVGVALCDDAGALRTLRFAAADGHLSLSFPLSGAGAGEADYQLEHTRCHAAKQHTPAPRARAPRPRPRHQSPSPHTQPPIHLRPRRRRRCAGWCATWQRWRAGGGGTTARPSRCPSSTVGTRASSSPPPPPT